MQRTVCTACLCLVLFAAVCVLGSGMRGCVGQDGTAVDWWVLIKAPGGQDAFYLDAITLAAYVHSASVDGEGPGSAARGIVDGGRRSSARRLRGAAAVKGGTGSCADGYTADAVSGTAVSGDMATAAHRLHARTLGEWRSAAALGLHNLTRCWSDAVDINGDSALQLTLHTLMPHATLAATAPAAAAAASNSAVSRNVQASGCNSSVLPQLEVPPPSVPSGLVHLMYNDEDPSTSKEEWLFAHAKGVLSFCAAQCNCSRSSKCSGCCVCSGSGERPVSRSSSDHSTDHQTSGCRNGCAAASTDVSVSSAVGFWITHSLPKFPASPSMGPGWELVQHAQTIFGQHALCLSLDAAAVETLASTLFVSRPFIYSSSLGGLELPALQLTHPAVARILGGEYDPAPRSVSLSLWTAAGTRWRLMVKSPHLPVLFHEAVVEPELGVGMAWETWQLGGGDLPSVCPPTLQYGSWNVRTVTMVGAVGGGWTSLHDHSKWGVSHRMAVALEGRQRLYMGDNRVLPGACSDAGYVCIGDLNRQAGQRLRGGGFACTADVPGLWAAFAGLVQDIEPCDTDAY